MNSFNPKTDSKSFWNKCKPYFSNKDNRNEASHVLSVENKTILKSNLEIAKIFINYFKSYRKAVKHQILG